MPTPCRCHQPIEVVIRNQRSTGVQRACKKWIAWWNSTSKGSCLWPNLHQKRNKILLSCHWLSSWLAMLDKGSTLFSRIHNVLSRLRKHSPQHPQSQRWCDVVFWDVFMVYWRIYVANGQKAQYESPTQKRWLICEQPPQYTDLDMELNH